MNIELGRFTTYSTDIIRGDIVARGECSCYLYFAVSFDLPADIIRGFTDDGQVLIRGGDNGRPFELTNVVVRTYGQSSSITLTDVTLSVPEPETWAMMIVGFGAVGFTMRRRYALRMTVAYA